ncbi:hypothetical protein [Anabaena sp. CS-542/02]|nr:hypothetical protein [Anabaena sp. CS-542/02]MDB9448183.1 hypothetical protein [Anabaena sp. CS-542/02]
MANLKAIRDRIQSVPSAIAPPAKFKRFKASPCYNCGRSHCAKEQY